MVAVGGSITAANYNSIKDSVDNVYSSSNLGNSSNLSKCGGDWTAHTNVLAPTPEGV